MNIIAVDLGKFNSMFCFYNSDTREHSTAKAPTDRSYFHSVFKSQQPDLVVVEACGSSGWVSDLCEELKLPILVCSTHWCQCRKTINSQPSSKSVANQLLELRGKSAHVSASKDSEMRTGNAMHRKAASILRPAVIVFGSVLGFDNVTAN